MLACLLPVQQGSSYHAILTELQWCPNAVPVPFWENGSSKLGPARSAVADSNSADKTQCTGYPGIDIFRLQTERQADVR